MKERIRDPLGVGDGCGCNIEEAELHHPVHQLAPRLADDTAHHHIAEQRNVDDQAKRQRSPHDIDDVVETLVQEEIELPVDVGVDIREECGRHGQIPRLFVTQRTLELVGVLDVLCVAAFLGIGVGAVGARGEDLSA